MTQTPIRQIRERAGRRVENWACFYLWLKGYKIIAKRYKTAKGEIDIIAKHKNTLIMTEVKQRQTIEQARAR